MVLFKFNLCLPQYPCPFSSILSHLSLGLPMLLFSPGLPSKIFCGTLLLFLLRTYPNHSVLLDLISVTMSALPLCPKSTRPRARKTKFCIWVVAIPNPFQNRSLVIPHTYHSGPSITGSNSGRLVLEWCAAAPSRSVWCSHGCQNGSLLAVYSISHQWSQSSGTPLIYWIRRNYKQL
jgi:hypothetical protein